MKPFLGPQSVVQLFLLQFPLLLLPIALPSADPMRLSRMQFKKHYPRIKFLKILKVTHMPSIMFAFLDSFIFYFCHFMGTLCYGSIKVHVVPLCPSSSTQPHFFSFLCFMIILDVVPKMAFPFIVPSFSG